MYRVEPSKAEKLNGLTESFKKVQDRAEPSKAEKLNGLTEKYFLIIELISKNHYIRSR